MNSDSIPENFLKLIEGCSIQAKIASRFWIVLAVVSIIAIMPTSINENQIMLPFNLGKVSQSDFYPFVAILISIIVIGFGSAQCQCFGTRKLINRVIKAQNNQVVLSGNIYLRDFIDSIISPSINRVAPLAQTTQGKSQFFPESMNCPKWRCLLSSMYYVVLKLASILIMYIFPAYALYHSFKYGNLFSWESKPWNLHIVFFWIFSAIAGIIILQLIYMDLTYLKNALTKRIATRYSNEQF